MNKLLELLESLREKHYTCEDCWYSCPLSEEGCCDDSQTGCTCGADYTNQKIDEAIALVKSLQEQK